ncbi:MAG: hypothetical protein GWN93_26860 [Deltaproteobacteria bacterium]|nr:hypothetical protein [Deltaproteobacteria bacterium]
MKFIENIDGVYAFNVDHIAAFKVCHTYRKSTIINNGIKEVEHVEKSTFAVFAVIKGELEFYSHPGTGYQVSPEYDSIEDAKDARRTIMESMGLNFGRMLDKGEMKGWRAT